MAGKRRVFGAAFEAKVARAAAKGDQTTAQLASLFGVHTSQVTAWKKQLMAQVAELFADGRQQRPSMQRCCEHDLRSSTRIKGPSSRQRPSRADRRREAWPSRWTVVAELSTTYSSNGCGERSSTSRSTCGTTSMAGRPRSRWGSTSTSTGTSGPTRPLATAHRRWSMPSDDATKAFALKSPLRRT
jgi:transposase